jgi:hypothetical protein
MSMLPRMKPRRFYDLIIQVAIVRPGPIRGYRVHLYLRRREGLEKPEYPRPELRAVLEKILGVPLFQEQAMKVAIVGAGFTPADRFERQRRTVMSTSMIGMKGRVQKEGEVIHVICDRIIDHGDLLHRVGDMSFPHRTGRGDGAKHSGTPDRGDKGWSPGPRNSYWPPHADGMDPEAVVTFKSQDFH